MDEDTCSTKPEGISHELGDVHRYRTLDDPIAMLNGISHVDNHRQWINVEVAEGCDLCHAQIQGRIVEGLRGHPSDHSIPANPRQLPAHGLDIRLRSHEDNRAGPRKGPSHVHSSVVRHLDAD